ncbi:unnamed protein product [Urochloa decumbens]|uniref:F-box domain-containing protein n=1 Tax=Urochloa decumbens TaxID=240449 RepID=A0ABC9BYN6_9POAL
MDSSCSCRRRRTEASPAARDWAGLPCDLLRIVFLKLGTREIMRGAEFACTAWRRVALKEPELWRRIYLPTIWRYSKAWRPMLRAALDRSAGKCVAFTGPCDNHCLLDLAERAPSLKILDLFDFIACNEVLDEALKQLPLLEDLEISPAYRSSDDSKRLFHPICQACPRLKKLVLGRQKVFANGSDNDDALDDDHHEERYYPHLGSWVPMFRPIVKKRILQTPPMSELRSLELFDCELNSAGLDEILDRCPVLESLHVTGPSVRGKIKKKIRAICAGLMIQSLPNHQVADDSDDESSDECSSDSQE